MNDILKITYKLTISCLIAALIMGGVFTLTHNAKKRNEHLNVQETMLSLLGYGKENPPPKDLRLYNIYRYIIKDRGKKYLGYMLPVKKGHEEKYELIILKINGELFKKYEMDIDLENALEPSERDKALRKIIVPPAVFGFADTIIVASNGKKRIAYLLPGEFPGFKTFVSVMLALTPDFRIMGLEIMEHEEDPGLGGEIEQDYFKNQFRDKSFQKIKEIKVVKKPLPEEYKRYLEMEKSRESIMTKEEIERIREKYLDSDIYAITGATISSRSVTNGVKNIVKKFAKRMKILDNVISSQHLVVAF